MHEPARRFSKRGVVAFRGVPRGRLGDIAYGTGQQFVDCGPKDVCLRSL